MPLRHSHRMVESRTTKPTLMTRLRGRNANSKTVKTTTKIEPASHHTTHATHAAHATRGTHAHNTRRSGWGSSSRAMQPVVHHKRHVSIGDKVSGAMMKLRGSLTGRPGMKAAGTRRMHGTSGRGARRVY
ncbi:hypothetical protein BJ875DRAFT_15760 [Amylocarpus encephaloides]|uniref:Uncharacterized protein n=1 Tax=Amylocarpus encephaloides TaxID=45428 RepID=A0A9P7YIB7_9HELO|nr:hypothetical protein BJ875DRAFT_15760 [Amylocarpus encephaloides]